MGFVKLTAMGRVLYVAVDKVLDIFARSPDDDPCPGGSNIAYVGGLNDIADQSPDEIMNLIKAMKS